MWREESVGEVHVWPNRNFILFQEEQIYRKWGKYKGTKGLIPRKTEYSQLEKKDQGIIIIKIVFNLSSKKKTET